MDPKLLLLLSGSRRAPPRPPNRRCVRLRQPLCPSTSGLNAAIVRRRPSRHMARVLATRRCTRAWVCMALQPSTCPTSAPASPSTLVPRVLSLTLPSLGCRTASHWLRQGETSTSALLAVVTPEGHDPGRSRHQEARRQPVNDPSAPRVHSTKGSVRGLARPFPTPPQMRLPHPCVLCKNGGSFFSREPISRCG